MRLRNALGLITLLAAAPAWAAPRRPAGHVARHLPPPRPVAGPLGRFMQVLDVTLGASTLHDAQARLGPAQVKDNGGSGPAAVAAVCYAGKDGTALALLAPALYVGLGLIAHARIMGAAGSRRHACQPRLI